MATPTGSDDRLDEHFRTGVLWLTVAAVAAVAVVPVLGNQLRVQDWDPQFARVIVERVQRFGGTFYENGIYNKGPLELIVYDVARHLGGYDGMWHVVSAFGALAAAVVALVAARTVRWDGAPFALAVAMGVGLYIHLTLSHSDYAGVLYARNITVALLAVAWLVTFEDRFWRSARSRTVCCVVGGAVLGLVAQTLISEAFSAGVIGIALLVVILCRAGAAERLKLMALAVGSSAVVFASAPAWYLLRGRFAEFWASWYGHAHLMSVGTGRSLGSQFALGWDQLYAYYKDRPLALVVIVAFAGFAYLTWSTAGWRERLMNVTLLGWLAGSWLEQFLNQRYSSHYFVINAVPTALMIAVLVGRAGRAASRDPRFRRAAIALPLAAVVGTLAVSEGKEFREAAERTSRFTSFTATAREQAGEKSGGVQAVRGVLDLVSRNGDPMLAWTNAPWPYLDVRRVAAGRFIWKGFLLGEIYLGGTGPQYVLPRTWDWFREDVRRSNPVAFVKTEDDPAAGTPFADLVDRQFQLVYSGSQAVYLRNDVARGVFSGPATDPWGPLPGTSPGAGWDVSPGTVTYRGSPGTGSSDAVPLVGQSCVRIDGTARTEDGSAPAFDVRFENSGTDPGGDLKQETLHLKLQGDKAISGSDAVEYESVSSGLQAAAAEPVRFSLVIGRRAAALVIGDQIRAAIRIPPSVTASLSSLGSSLAISDLRMSGAPPLTGC
jgi:hypothetical protein